VTIDEIIEDLERQCKFEFPNKVLGDASGVLAQKLKTAIQEERKQKEKRKFKDDLAARVTLVSAFRYALGRKTYAVRDVQETICDNIDILPVPMLQTMKNELDMYMEDSDDAQWILFENYLTNEIERRKDSEQNTKEKADRAVDGPGGTEAGPHEA